MSDEAIGYDDPAFQPASSRRTDLLARPAVARSAKRTIDLLGAGILLVLALPTMIAIAVVVKLTDGGPIFYRSRMLGRADSTFTMLKFRTMILGADDWLRQHPDLEAEFLLHMKLLDDPRVTRVGKILRRFSLDELPQLINVLAGDMSLVGPRPVRPWELSRWGDFGTLRQSVPPGLTGLWQVSGRSLIAYEQRAAFDRMYVEQWSVWLDCRILVSTIRAVFTARGAN